MKRHGGHNKIVYQLSVSCFEYFIAKRVEAVWQVYHKVFHASADFQEALHTPFNGIMPIYQDGFIGYERKGVLLSVGRSPKNGHRLAQKYPDECRIIGGRSYITLKLGNLLQEQYNVRQLEINFNNPQNLK